MRTYYVVPNFECNMACSHCKIHTLHFNYDRHHFLETLRSFQDGSTCILFGGEPTLYNDRFSDCIATNKINTISTNLLNVSDSQLSAIAAHKINIATSWNKSRFLIDQEKKWQDNLAKLEQYGLSCKIIITMTPDLIYGSIEEFKLKLQTFNNIKSVRSILFEHLIFAESTQQFYDDCDSWLCEMHKIWNFRIANDIDTKILDWKFDCSNTYTLLPTGQVISQCPHLIDKNFNMQCLSCKYNIICKPCRLHKQCTFPKKLYELVKE